MTRARKTGIAALFAALAAMLAAAFLCLGVTFGKAEAETPSARSLEDIVATLPDVAVTDGVATVASWEELVVAINYDGATSNPLNPNGREADTIKLSKDVTFDFINDTDLQTLMTAFAAGTGGNADSLYITRDVVIDLGGNTLTVDTTNEEFAVAVHDGAAVTIQNGVLAGETKGDFALVGTAEDGKSSLTLQDLTVSVTSDGTVSDSTGQTRTPRAVFVAGKLHLDTVSFQMTDAIPVDLADLPIGEVSYQTLQDAVNAAPGTGYSYAVSLADVVDVNGSVTIPKATPIQIDLAGKTLTNTAGKHTVVNYGSVTFTDSEGGGKVTNTTESRAALFNYGYAYLYGGEFTRDAAASHYVLKNLGDMTIGKDEKSAVKVSSENTGASLIANGFVDAKEQENEKGNITAAATACTLEIKGGTFTGGMNNVKNDFCGKLTVSGGTFVNSYEGGSVILAAGENTQISGGSFTQKNMKGSVLRVSVAADTTVKVAVSGGTFTGEGMGESKAPAVRMMREGEHSGMLDVTVSGGTFNGSFTTGTTTGGNVGADDKLIVTDGTFNGGFGGISSLMQAELRGGDYALIPGSNLIPDDVNIYKYTQDAGDKAGSFVLGTTPPASTEPTGYVKSGNDFYKSIAEAIKKGTSTSINLYADITESVTVTGKMTVKLDGHTWAAEEGHPALTVNAPGTVTVMCGSADGGKIVRNDAGAAIVVTSGTLSLSGTSKAYEVSNTSGALIENSGTLTVGGKVTLTAETAVDNQSGGTLKVTGSNVVFAATGTDIVNAGDLTISNGTFNGANANIQNKDGAVTGSGGTYNHALDESYIKDGYLQKEQGGTYTVVKIVATIVNGNNTYDFIEDEWETNAAKTLADLTGDIEITTYDLVKGGLTVKAGQNITLTVGSNLFGAIVNGGTLTIKGDGIIKDQLTNNGTLIIEGCTFEKGFTFTSEDVTITGGTFKGGRTVNKGEGNDYLLILAPYLADGYYFIDHTLLSGNKYTVGQGTLTAVVTDGEIELAFGSFTAAVGYLQFGADSADITIRLEADVDLSDNLTLEANYQSYAKSVTLDLNGHSISPSAKELIVDKGMKVTIKGDGDVSCGFAVTDGDLTVKGGTYAADMSAYLAEGYVQTATGKVVSEDKITASITRDGETLRYASLADAVKNAMDGETVEVTNTGKMDAWHTVLKFVQEPHPQLVGFCKVWVPAGETVTVQVRQD